MAILYVRGVNKTVIDKLKKQAKKDKVKVADLINKLFAKK